MPIVISSSLVISHEDLLDDDNPVFLWENLITAALLSSGLVASPTTSVDDADHPVANLANGTTNQYWQANTNSDNIFIQAAFDGLNPIDALGIAVHNLGTGSWSLKIYGATALDINEDPVYSAITDDFLLADDAPVIVRFTEANYIALKVEMTDTQSGAAEAPLIAVMYAGKLLVSQRKLQVSFTPITLGRKTEALNGRSENGKFLGRIITSAWVETAANIAFLTPAWYRTYFRPFVLSAQQNPFFFAWAPVSFPDEVGYAWLTNDAIPAITHSGKATEAQFMAITLQMQGVI